MHGAAYLGISVSFGRGSVLPWSPRIKEIGLKLRIVSIVCNIQLQSLNTKLIIISCYYHMFYVISCLILLNNNNHYYSGIIPLLLSRPVHHCLVKLSLSRCPSTNNNISYFTNDDYYCKLQLMWFFCNTISLYHTKEDWDSSFSFTQKLH